MKDSYSLKSTDTITFFSIRVRFLKVYYSTKRMSNSGKPNPTMTA